jgi:hypothetical protein
MAMQGDMHRPNALGLWWGRWLARRRMIARTVTELAEGYGPAAYGIARNTARGRAADRRFWRAVARRLRWRRLMALR